MCRGAKPTKPKAEAELASWRPEVAEARSLRRRQLEKRLAEAQEQQTATAEVLQARNRELSEALEQQTATSEILRVISSSPMDAHPTFEAIAAAATTLCAAENAGVFLFDGRLIHFAAHHRLTAEDLDAIRQVFPRPPGRGSVTARAILTRAVAHVPDLRNDPEYEDTSIILTGFRSVLSVPMLRNGQPIGAINVARRAGALHRHQIALLETFAWQAVIAIENVRLFTELETRNRDLNEALEQQTATSEILRVISSSPTDVQPVFDTIAERAMRLCRAKQGIVVTFDGELIHVAALAHVEAEGVETLLRQAFPMRPDRGSGFGRAVLTKAAVHLPSVLDDPEYAHGAFAQITGFRSALAVPMLSDGKVIGAIGVGRLVHGSFSDREIALLETFADQAVIAVENVRLFKELEARNTDLTEALEQQTADERDSARHLELADRSAASLRHDHPECCSAV